MSTPTENRRHLEQGLAHHRAGRIADAERIYREVLTEDSNNADAYHFLGLIAHGLGRQDEANRLISRAIALDEPRATFHLNLGSVRLAAGALETSLAAYGRAAALDPALAAAHVQCGNILSMLERSEEAEVAFAKALAADPEMAEALSGLSALARRRGANDEAIAYARRAIARKPELAAAWTNLANALETAGDALAAEGAHREAVRLAPDDAAPHFNLATLLHDTWRPTEAAAAYRAALSLDPTHRGANSNLLTELIYAPDQSGESLYRAHLAWAERCAPSTSMGHRNERDPDRRLRVGYVSADFRTHSCAYFIEPLLAAHDARAVETFVYSNLRRADGMTERFRALVPNWRDIRGRSTADAAARVQADGIDILVDLNGHTAENRLDVFALKPAPVQVSWLGYPSTTGLTAIDYRLTDAVADPPGAADFWHSESLVRLPNGFLCYLPPKDAPDPGATPSVRAGFVTFGSFNNLAKVTDVVVALWAEIMRTVPDARLVLKAQALDHPSVRDRVHRAFAAAGVASERIRTLGWIARDRNPILAYRDIDVALDPFPYNGTTTTCEALWMGVPSVTLSGDRHSARVGTSILTAGGLPELIAPSPAGYAAIAVELARDPLRIAHYRANLRERIARSPLCDAAGFAQRIEEVYRVIWRRWCASEA